MYQTGNSQPTDGALPSKTPVSLLQELCMRRGISPKYDLLQIEGPVHEPTFVYRVTVGEYAANGSGQTKKKAKHAAAKAVLDIIIQGGSGSTGQSSSTPEISSSQVVSPYDDGIPGNPVGQLQELCMSRRWPPPTYELTAEEGFPHERTFSICCTIGSHKDIAFFQIIGAGKSKKLSKRQAAHKMIQKLKDQPVEHLPMNVLADDDDEVKLDSTCVPGASCPTLTKACPRTEKPSSASLSYPARTPAELFPLELALNLSLSEVGSPFPSAFLKDKLASNPQATADPTLNSFDTFLSLQFKCTCPHLSPHFDGAYRICKACYELICQNNRRRVNASLSTKVERQTLVYPQGSCLKPPNGTTQDPLLNSNCVNNDYVLSYADYDVEKLQQIFEDKFPLGEGEGEEDGAEKSEPKLNGSAADQSLTTTKSDSDQDYYSLSPSEKLAHINELNQVEPTKIQFLMHDKSLESEYEQTSLEDPKAAEEKAGKRTPKLMEGLLKNYSFKVGGGTPVAETNGHEANSDPSSSQFPFEATIEQA